ncbi:hypothetical protein FACS18949_14350 [Clostridia bacterium]|nr:hypothetical protein FACS189425_07160 [Clostridia bacterium]GHV35762.1 hypothetical protein FACS18949_14350 [Clostridia bacterium]
MNELKKLNYERYEVRYTDCGGETWWVLKDVCDVLGLTDPTKVSQRLESDELSRIKVGIGGQTHEMLTVNEPGLYNVLMRSDKPVAKQFKRWITHDVIPGIRRTGSYSAPGKSATPKVERDEMHQLLFDVFGRDIFPE